MNAAQQFAHRVADISDAHDEKALDNALKETKNPVLLLLECMAKEKEELSPRKLEILKMVKGYKKAKKFFQKYNVPTGHYMFRYKL